MGEKEPAFIRLLYEKIIQIVKFLCLVFSFVM